MPSARRRAGLREAGLPETTRSERLRERFARDGGDSGGFGSRLGEPRYLVAIFVVLALAAGGIAYAVLAGSDDEAGGKPGKQASQAVKPSEIEVTVLNGTAVDGLAGTYGDMVERKGFQLGAVTNSRSSFSDSVVMFEQGNGREAHRVATALEISRVRPMNAEIASLSAGAPVAVVIGEDNASSTG